MSGLGSGRNRRAIGDARRGGSADAVLLNEEQPGFPRKVAPPARPGVENHPDAAPFETGPPAVDRLPEGTGPALQRSTDLQVAGRLLGTTDGAGPGQPEDNVPITARSAAQAEEVTLSAATERPQRLPGPAFLRFPEDTPSTSPVSCPLFTAPS